MKLRAALMPVLTLAALTLAMPLAAQARMTTPDGSSTTGWAEPRAAGGLRTALTPNGSWPVYHHDNAHTGADLTLNSVGGVKPGWTSAVMDDRVFASPLIYGGIVYAATLNNTVYAFNQTDGSLVWSNHLRAPETTGWGCGNVSPQGILGTPVVDPGTGRIFVTTLDTTDDHYRLEGLNLLTGVEEVNTDISLFIGGAFDWTIEQQRGALAVANGYVYVPFGGRAGDCGNYHGWVFAVPVSGAAIANYYVTPGSGSGFWAAGGVVVDNSTGKVFVTSGNAMPPGSGCAANANGTPVFENNAVIRLSATMAHEDSFIPQDWMSSWCSNDEDLGSAGPLLISPNLIFQSGKWGTGFLLNPANLGGMDGQLFPTPRPAAYTEIDVCLGAHASATFGSFAYAAPYIYVECEGQGLVALNLNTGVPSFSACDATCAAPSWHAGSGTYGPPIVAAGAVWVANGSGLYAYRASTGALIYHSAAFGFNRFVTPAEAGGQVFVPAGNVMKQFVMAFGVSQSGSPASPPGRPTPAVQAIAPPPVSRQAVGQTAATSPPPR
jgi:polyvinyl alcohol dehydrogenase (cytochrome)